MAIYHLNAKVVSGRKGSSAIAHSAYMNAIKLIGLDSKVRDYTHKSEVQWTNFVTPDDYPAWAKDRQKFWTAVEKREGAAGRYARSYDIALPNELTQDQQIALINDFVDSSIVKRHMLADVALHASDSNIHVHLMTNARDLDANGEWLEKSKKIYLDENGNEVDSAHKVYDKNKKTYICKTKKLNDWDDKKTLEAIRIVVAPLILAFKIPASK